MKIPILKTMALCLVFFCMVSGAADRQSLSQADKDVDALLTKISSGGNAQNIVINDIRKMGKAAVPRLIQQASAEYVFQKQGVSFGGPSETFSREAKSPNPKRFPALFLLQFAWSAEAAAPLLAILRKDSNQDARLLALAALNKNARDSIKEILPELVKDQNPEISGIAFEHLELVRPDENRILELVDKPVAWKFLELYLPRYYSAELSPKTMLMLKNGRDTDEKTAAIASLINQNANSPETRKYISGLLKAYDSAVREMAAEYLLWHGTENELPDIDVSLKAEEDIYASAAMSAAVKSIRRRACMKTGEAVSFPGTFEGALKVLRSERYAAGVSEGLKVLSQAEPFEPLYIQGKEHDEAFDRQRNARMELTGLVFSIPLFLKNNENRPEEKTMVAESLVPPVRNYHDPARKAFGSRLSPTQAIVRLGDTAGFRQTYLTVVSIGNGIVKAAEYNLKHGFSVVVEHSGADGRKFCSVYTHLSPFIHVSKGDFVAVGQKVGAIGRHFTWENGGYGAHLYFGIYNDSFESCQNWQMTYMPEEDFAKGTKWVNPQTFLQKYKK
ncbi:MAG: peptidoglycan DD-metalloendopeptidase family protein [Victivallales bacterium]